MTKSDNESVETAGNRLARPKRKVWLIALLFVMAIPAILCGLLIRNVATCDSDIASDRPHNVEAAPLLELELPEESFPIRWHLYKQNVQYRDLFETKVIVGVGIRFGGSETIEETRSVFDELCGGEAPAYGYEYDPARFSYGGEGDRRYCASHILGLRQFNDGTFLCETYRYDSYTVIQNGKILFVLSESTDDTKSHGLSTNRAIHMMAEELWTSFEELNEMDAKSRLVWESVNWGAHGRDLRGSDLSQSDLSGASFTGTDLRDSDLTAAKLSGADLSFADLRGASLRDADFQKADLVQAKFDGTDLEGANLSGARLHAARLEGVDLHSANLNTATYNQLTTWPAGFDPEAAGAIFDGN